MAARRLISMPQWCERWGRRRRRRRRPEAPAPSARACRRETQTQLGTGWIAFACLSMRVLDDRDDTRCVSVTSSVVLWSALLHNSESGTRDVMGAALSTTGAAAGKGRALSGAASRAKERARVWLVPALRCTDAVFCTQQYRPCGQISCAPPAGWNAASTAEPEPAKFLASWLAGSAVFSCARSPDVDGDSHTAHKSQSLASLTTLAVLFSAAISRPPAA